MVTPWKESLEAAQREVEVTTGGNACVRPTDVNMEAKEFKRANGVAISCRDQIHQQTEYQVRHFADVLQHALPGRGAERA